MNNLVFDPSSKFLDPERVLFAAGLGSGQTFADLGAGSGFYSLAASKITGEHGMIYSVDILESALDHISAEARLKGLRNIKTLLCDLEQVNSCQQIITGTVDMVLFANIAHQIEKPANLFGEAYRLLKTGGKLMVVEWNEQPSPIGPSAAERLGEAQVTQLANKSGLKAGGKISTDPYHYGIVFIK